MPGRGKSRATFNITATARSQITEEDIKGVVRRLIEHVYCDDYKISLGAIKLILDKFIISVDRAAELFVEEGRIESKAEFDEMLKKLLANEVQCE